MAAITSAVIGGASLIQGNRNAGRAERASRNAADTQAFYSNKAIKSQEKSLNKLIKLNNPFRKFGANRIGQLENRLRTGLLSGDVRGDISQARNIIGQDNPALNRLTSLTTDPNAQRDFIQNNPFYESLAQGAQDRLFSNEAARGKVGSGGTAAELQNRLTMLGSDLLSREIGQLQGAAGTASQIGSTDISNLLGVSGFETGLQQQDISNLFGAVGLGQNAAAMQGNAIQGSANQISNLMTGIGNARAAGQVGAANAQQQGFNNILNSLSLGAGIYGNLSN